MARLPYPDPKTTGPSELIARIKAQRGDVLHLYAMLLHSGPMAEGWLSLLTAVRQKGVLPGALRELVIMQVALINGAPYEAEQHRPIALREGLSAAQVDGLKDWRACTAYDARQRAVLAYCEEMTRSVHVDDKVFADVREQFNAQELVELTITIAAYNMVSRFLEAIGITAADDRGDWS